MLTILESMGYKRSCKRHKNFMSARLFKIFFIGLETMKVFSIDERLCLYIILCRKKEILLDFYFKKLYICVGQ